MEKELKGRFYGKFIKDLTSREIESLKLIEKKYTLHAQEDKGILAKKPLFDIELLVVDGDGSVSACNLILIKEISAKDIDSFREYCAVILASNTRKVQDKNTVKMSELTKGGDATIYTSIADVEKLEGGSFYAKEIEEKGFVEVDYYYDRGCCYPLAGISPNNRKAYKGNFTLITGDENGDR